LKTLPLCRWFTIGFGIFHIFLPFLGLIEKGPIDLRLHLAIIFVMGCLTLIASFKPSKYLCLGLIILYLFSAVAEFAGMIVWLYKPLAYVFGILDILQIICLYVLGWLRK